jgi:hypothetical protein
MRNVMVFRPRVLRKIRQQVLPDEVQGLPGDLHGLEMEESMVGLGNIWWVIEAPSAAR